MNTTLSQGQKQPKTFQKTPKNKTKKTFQEWFSLPSPFTWHYKNKSPLCENTDFEEISQKEIDEARLDFKCKFFPNKVFIPCPHCDTVCIIKKGKKTLCKCRDKNGKKRTVYQDPIEHWEKDFIARKGLEPKYVKWCKNESHSMFLYNEQTGENLISRFKCKSWRHDGECARYRGAQDYARIEQAIKKCGDEWTYFVLTFKREKNLYDAYKDIVFCWDKLRKRIERHYGKFQYICLIEQHKDGYPHLNVLIHNKKLYQNCSEEFELTPPPIQFGQTLIRETKKVFGWYIERECFWNRHVEESGFGWNYHIEPMKSRQAMAGYFVKLIGMMAAEFNKPSQIPKAAPLNFRRLRTSKGLLAPIEKASEEWTGGLIPVSMEKIIFDYQQQTGSEIKLTDEEKNKLEKFVKKLDNERKEIIFIEEREIPF